MAHYIPHRGPIQHNIQTPLTLTALQQYVGGLIHFMELLSGDVLVVNDEPEIINRHLTNPVNPTASALAGQFIIGDAVLCEPGEIA